MNTMFQAIDVRPHAIFASLALIGSSATATTVIDNFTQSQAGITTFDYAGNGASVAGVGSTDLTFGSTGAGVWGRRLVCTNSWGAPNASVSAAMPGNGQFAVSLFGGDSADNQIMAQYKFDSAIDMTLPANSQIRISGSGSASGTRSEAYGIGIILFSGLGVGQVITGWTGPDEDVPVYGPGAVYSARWSKQIDMTGIQSLGDFTFNVADLGQGFDDSWSPASAALLSSVNGFAVFQYAYGGSTWNYTATSFSIVPAPGVAALMAAAGAVASRRRKP